MAPGNNPASSRIWNPLQIPMTSPPSSQTPSPLPSPEKTAQWRQCEDSRRRKTRRAGSSNPIRPTMSPYARSSSPTAQHILEDILTIVIAITAGKHDDSDIHTRPIASPFLTNHGTAEPGLVQLPASNEHRLRVRVLRARSRPRLLRSTSSLQLVPIFFNDRIRQQLLAHGLHLSLSLILSVSFTSTSIYFPTRTLLAEFEPQRVQRVLNRLPLRIENALLQRHMNFCLHD